MAAAEALMSASPDDPDALARARREAQSRAPFLTPAVLQLLEAEVRESQEYARAHARVAPEPDADDVQAKLDAPIELDNESLANAARARAADALGVGDLRGALTASRTVAILGALPTPRDTSDDLDYTRLTDAELECLEALVQVARGNRPAAEDRSRIADWLEWVRCMPVDAANNMVQDQTQEAINGESKM